MSSKPQHRVDREEFRKRRVEMLAVAASGQAVVISDNSRDVALVVTPRDKLPMRFD